MKRAMINEDGYRGRSSAQSYFKKGSSENDFNGSCTVGGSCTIKSKKMRKSVPSGGCSNGMK